MKLKDLVKIKIPKALYSFGARVTVKWREAECGETEGTISGINYDFRGAGSSPSYTITEDNGMQTDDIPEGWISAA